MYEQFFGVFWKLPKSWIGFMKDLLHTDPNHMELQNDLCTSSVLVHCGLQESWWANATECYCNLRSVQGLLADGQTPCEPRFTSPYSIWSWSKILPHIYIYMQKTMVECISSAQQSSKNVHAIRVERGVEDWWSIYSGCEDLKTMPPSERHSRDNEFVFPWKTGKILQERQPLFLTVGKISPQERKKGPGDTSQKHSLKWGLFSQFGCSVFSLFFAKLWRSVWQLFGHFCR